MRQVKNIAEREKFFRYWLRSVWVRQEEMVGVSIVNVLVFSVHRMQCE